MNFLSHYYFDQHNKENHTVLGVILPDLLKNTDKTWNAHPQKTPEIFNTKYEKDLLKGWKRHLEVDLYFHSSDFFKDETQKLKELLKPILIESPVRPSFLAHIGVELTLDHLLITKNKISVTDFYYKIENTNINAIDSFLNKSAIKDVERFNKFLINFNQSKYLTKYDKISNIAYALKRICMRLWSNPISEKTENELGEIIEFYKNHLAEKFMLIFDQIEERLN